MRFLPKPLAVVVTLAGLFASVSTLAQTVVATQPPPPAVPVVVVTAPPPAPTTAPIPGTTPVPKAVPKNFINDLAKASLAKQGIAHPTPAQLAAERKSIADQRAQGKGWGVIAQSLGLNLGQVISSANHARHDARKEHHAGGKHHKRDADKHEQHGEHKAGDHSAGGQGGSHGGGKGK